MEPNLNRTEKFLAVAAVSAIGAFIFMFLQINYRPSSSMSQIETSGQIDYQMAKPVEGYSEYSLNGREIEEVYEGLEAKQAVFKTSDKKTKTEVIKKAVTAKKKIEDTKKAQTRAAQLAAYNKKVAEVKKAWDAHNARKKAEANSKTEAETQANNSSPSAPFSGAENRNQPPILNDPKAKNKKTFAEWRAQIFAQPTRETVDALMAAYRKNEVTAAEVQALAQDLLDQNDDKMKGLGLYVLRSAPSMGSLSQMVHAEPEVNDSLKAYIGQAYLAYLQPQNVGYLNQALQTKDKTLILKSLNILGVNLQKLSQGDYSSLNDPRNRRDSGAVSQFSMTSFTSLVPALTTLSQSQDQELISPAQQVLGFIQSTNTVATN